jgi:hypothetical protein
VTKRPRGGRVLLGAAIGIAAVGYGLSCGPFGKTSCSWGIGDPVEDAGVDDGEDAGPCDGPCKTDPLDGGEDAGPGSDGGTDAG